MDKNSTRMEIDYFLRFKERFNEEIAQWKNLCWPFDFLHFFVNVAAFEAKNAIFQSVDLPLLYFLSDPVHKWFQPSHCPAYHKIVFALHIFRTYLLTHNILQADGPATAFTTFIFFPTESTR